MTEKNKIENESKKERFEFVLTINDFVVCQRYFRINGFKPSSVHSLRFLDKFRTCVRLIKEDLEAKSRLYLWLTAPQVLDTEEDVQKWAEEHKGKPCFSKMEGVVEVLSRFKFNPDLVLCRKTENAYLWDGEKLTPYTEYFNKGDYASPVTTDPCTLKFAFLDNGREVLSEIWDGNVYPKFIRNNIDLSNSRNKYKSDSYSPFESVILDTFIKSQVDIIPIIIRELCVSASTETEKDDFKYLNINTNLAYTRSNFIKSYEKGYTKKTEKYLKNLEA